MHNEICHLYLYGRKDNKDNITGKVTVIECTYKNALNYISDKNLDYNGKARIEFKDGKSKYYRDYGEECDCVFHSLNKSKSSY